MLHCHWILLSCSLHLPFHLLQRDFLRRIFFCSACTPVEAEHGSAEGRKAKRRLAFKICQLEGKHMSGSDTASDVRYHSAGAEGGKTASVVRIKNVGGERGKCWCCLRNYAGAGNPSVRAKLSCSEV